MPKAKGALFAVHTAGGAGNPEGIETGRPPREKFPGRGTGQRCRDSLTQKPQRLFEDCPVSTAGTERHRAMSLTDLLAARGQGQRQMKIPGNGMLQRIQDKNLAGGGAEQILAPHHLIDPGVGIVDHYGQLIGEQTVRPFQYKVAHRGGQRITPRAKDAIDKTDRPVRHRIRTVRGRRPAATPWRQVPG